MIKKLYIKRIFILIIIAVLVIALPACDSRSANSDVALSDESSKSSISNTTVKTGDYISFGSYYDEPILWQCIKTGSEGIMLQSYYILCCKSYDAAESGEYGMASPSADDSGSQRYGSNVWSNSNIREWLNSADQSVKFTTQPPVASAVTQGINPYADEPGFLYNFSASERSKIMPVSHNEVNDYVYLLSEDELKMGSVDIEKTPTAKAVENTKEENSSLEVGSNYFYWTRTPSTANTYKVMHISSRGYLSSDNRVTSGVYGIVPALNLRNNIKVSGKGTISEPYIVQ